MLGQELHGMVEEDFVETFPKNFVVFAEQLYGPVVLHQSFIASLETRLESGTFPVFRYFPEALPNLHDILKKATCSTNYSLIEESLDTEDDRDIFSNSNEVCYVWILMLNIFNREIFFGIVHRLEEVLQ